MPQSATTRVVLAMIAAICVTLITTALDTSPTVSLIGATLAAAVPALINTGGRHGVVLGVGVTAVALGVTYVGFTAADAATDRPATFPRSKDAGNWVEKQIPTEVDVPAVLEKPYAEAEATLNDAGLKVDRNDVASNKQPDTVVGQDPDAGRSVEKGTTVTLSVSASPQGGQEVAVPNVIGQPVIEARLTLESAGFAVMDSPEVVDDQSKVGVVLTQFPVGGSLEPVGASVMLTVGAAP